MHQCPGSPDSEQSGEVQSTIEIDRQLLFSEWLVIMQNPNEDTEWNDVLRAKGIIPEKPKEAEVTLSFQVFASSCASGQRGGPGQDAGGDDQGEVRGEEDGGHGPGRAGRARGRGGGEDLAPDEEPEDG